jgi:protein-tyrosine phosphatase
MRARRASGAPVWGALDSPPVRYPGSDTIARRALRLLERILHGWRRRAAVALLRRRPAPRSVLFVCHGNICRSPFAAGLARSRFPDGIAVGSAGFAGSDRPSPPAAVEVAAEHGIDLSEHRSQELELGHLREVDLVLVMERRQRHRLVAARPELADRVLLLGDLDPEPATRRAIPDPVNQPAPVFRSCYQRIDRCVGALATLWDQETGDAAQGEGGQLEDGGRRQADE